MRICTVVFDYRKLNRYARLFDVWDKSVRASNPDAIIDTLKVDAPAWDGSQKASYFSNNYKMQLWVDYLKKVDDDVIFMDCDMVVLKPLKSAFESDFDIGLVTVGRGYAPYNGGVVFVRNSEKARAFMDVWRRVDQELFEDEVEHRQWGAKYAGQNQAALGKMIETGDTAGAKIKEFPSMEWNAVDPDWNKINAKNCRVIHIKSKLRKICLGEERLVPRGWEWPVNVFRSFEGPEHDINQIRKDFKLKTGYSPNLDKPQTLMEKITVSKITNRDPLLTMSADKVAVREYVQEKGLGDYIVPMLYESAFPVKLPWGKLPDAFFIKMNNASGRNLAIEFKRNTAQVFLEKKINDWMKVPYGVDKGEWAYKNITARVVVEPLLPGNPMKAVKFHCFHGEPKIGQVIKYTREKKIVSITTSYVPEWAPLPLSWAGYKIGNEGRPDELEQLMEMSARLAGSFEYVRVDWLIDGTGKIWFSELTHYPTGGRAKIEPVSFDKDFGKLWRWDNGV